MKLLRHQLSPIIACMHEWSIEYHVTQQLLNPLFLYLTDTITNWHVRKHVLVEVVSDSNDPLTLGPFFSAASIKFASMSLDLLHQVVCVSL